jgi:hypothetical protein
MSIHERIDKLRALARDQSAKCYAISALEIVDELLSIRNPPIAVTYDSRLTDSHKDELRRQFDGLRGPNKTLILDRGAQVTILRPGRFLVFSGEDYYPIGGWDDWEGEFDTIEQAETKIHSLRGDWAQIVDRDQQKEIATYSRSRGEWSKDG